jgi:NADH-quinone oxidoreductase subunit M
LFQTNTIATFYATSGIVLCAGYSIWIYNRLCFGSINTKFILNFVDLTQIEIIMLLPFSLLIIFLGVYPLVLLDNISFSILLIKFILDNTLI